MAEPNEQAQALKAWGIDFNEDEERELVERGLSASKLLARIRKVNPEWTWVKRSQGEVIPTPCVVHLQFGPGTGHYSAALETRPLDVRVEDPFLGITDWIEQKAVNSCASGFFLVPDTTNLPPGFLQAGAAELEQVFGRDSCPSSRDEEECKNKPKCGGMIVGSISKFLPAVSLYDEPLNYQPPYGPGIDLTLQYHPENYLGDSIQNDTSHFGPGWKHGLLSYIRASDGSSLPSQGSVQWVFASSFNEYTRSGASYVARYTGRPALTNLTAGFRLTFNDGSQMDFNQPNSATPTRFYLTKVRDAQGHELTLNYDSLMRLSNIIDAAEGVTEFVYEGEDLKIRSIVDPFGRQATMEYDENGRLQRITDVLGMVSTVEHVLWAPERVQSFTTPYGTTSYTYEGSPSLWYTAGWAVTATDPEGYSTRVESYYHDGDTPFTVGADAEQRPPASIQVGGTMAAFLPTVALSDHFHVTLSWNRKQWREYEKALSQDSATDPKRFAECILWLMGSNSDSRQVPLAHKNPGEAAEWYNYAGQTAGKAWQVGTGDQPIRTARQTEDENGNIIWVMTQQTYNVHGLPLEFTDEKGRKLRFTYHGNNRDISTIQALVGGSWQTLRSYSNYVRGLPRKIAEASGLVTDIQRNLKDQPTLITVSKVGGGSESTRITYDTDGLGAPDNQPGYPVKIERTSPDNPADWVTVDILEYDDFGRVRTHRDEENYATVYDYDTFDRLTLITHPNGSTQQYVYDRLDLMASKEQDGRWTRTLHDRIRRPIVTIDPAEKTVWYDWCSCGSLYKLTDAAGRVTEWKRDILGRVTEKIMPDGVTKTTYSYYPRSGKLATITRPNQQGGSPTVTYRYFTDGRLQKEDYTNNSSASGAADVIYAYEASGLGRLLTVADGIGTHSYAYRALTSGTSGTAGAGGIEFINGPLTNDRVQFVYDWQDRVSTENLIPDSSTSTNLRAESRTWDSLGRLKSVSNTLDSFTFAYSTPLSRLDSLNRLSGITTGYTYLGHDAPGHSARALSGIQHQTSARQFQHSYHYDAAGRITQWDRTHSYQVSDMVFEENTIAKFAYDLNGQLQFAETQGFIFGQAQSLDIERWSLDAAGNWLSRSRTGDAMETRTHNVMNQLTQTGGAGRTLIEGTVNEFANVSVNGQPARLQADPVGGGYRFSRMQDVAEGENTVTISATDQDNETTTQNWSFTVPPVARSFSYDANGNLLNDGQRTFTWDVKNRLRTVRTGAGTPQDTTWKWDYDHQDRRVREYQNGALTKVFIWSGTEVVQERNASNVITRTHYFGGFSDGADPSVGTKYQTLTDHLGNVRDVLAANGEVAARYDYTSYQGPVKLDGSVDATFQTIGRYYHHTGSGLELALYRAYDAGLGRWISEDPLEEEGGINLYGYVGNMPIGAWDPLGLEIIGFYDGADPGAGNPFVATGKHMKRTCERESDRSFSVRTLKDAADIAEKLRNQGVTINVITIVDHGGPGHQEIGNDFINPHDPDWTRLTSAITPDGSINLAGCRVAKGELGKNYLEALSKAAGGRPVNASPKYQWHMPWGRVSSR